MRGFENRRFEIMVEKWGEDTASDLAYLGEIAAQLYKPGPPSALIASLRSLAADATSLADTLKEQMDDQVLA
jgi:hypothetical protein